MLMPLLKGVRNVFEEDETEHDMLILGRIHVVAHFVGGCPEGCFKAKRSAVAIRRRGLLCGSHAGPFRK